MSQDKWLEWAVRLQALAQTGLAYGKDVYDMERFEEIRQIAAEMLVEPSGQPLEVVKDLFCNETGYQTPKLDTRAAIFQEDKILLVQENDGLWSLPGGHIEEGENFHDSVVREVFEETGLTIANARLVGIKHWPDKEGYRYIVFLYKATEFTGTIRSTEEGEVRWVEKSDLSQMDLAYDLLEILKVMDEPDLSEFFYTRKNDDGEWDKNFR
ncbi:NUDIX hydrolase N-terminal domain-containing protein [Streptococcus suis]